MAAELDPVTAEVLRHIILSIPKQIDANVARTAYTPLVYDYKDYAVGLLDHEGRLISQGGGGAPIFVANALGTAVQDGFLVHGRAHIEPGDIIFTNHADTLGQHLNNVVMYTPVFYGDKDDEPELVGFVAILVHWIDVGGAASGSVSFRATQIFHEGVQFRSVKLWSRGVANNDIYRTIEANTRFPTALIGDVHAQVAGCLRGRDMVLDVLRKYGVETFRRSVKLMWHRSESAARAVVRDIPDGVYSGTSFLDNDGVRQDRTIPVNVTVTVEGDEMTVDFSDMARQVEAPINSGREGGAVAVARIAFKLLATPDEPANDGAFRPLKIIAPEGTIISARPGAAMGFYSSILPTIVDTILKAMTDAAPDRVAGGHHGSFNSVSYSGTHPKTGELYTSLDTGHGGWGASNGDDGPGPFKTMIHGDTFGLPVEAHEVFYPVRVEGYGIRPDSGGAGKFRGGNGTQRVVEVLSPMTINVNIERTLCPAWGVQGGHDGQPAACFVERPGTAPVMILKGVMSVAAGDRIHLLCGGGGGYGDPRERDPERVVMDVRRGYVSRSAAEELYGVVLDEACNVLSENTRIRRSSGMKPLIQA